jgi:ribulose-5-phosphate 4-epimerase/fuculose-1-phosphate aldolase
MYQDCRTSRNEFVKTGQATWDLGLNSLKSGNISVLLPKGDILITKTGRSLRELNPDTDLVITRHSDEERGEASCEFYVHRGIYRGTKDEGRGAILHCHPPCTIAASFVWPDKIPSSYNEARDVIEATPIVESRNRESLGEDPALIAAALTTAKIVAIRGHGTFALAATLEECLYLTHLLENSCRVLFMRSNAAAVRGCLP